MRRVKIIQNNVLQRITNRATKVLQDKQRQPTEDRMSMYSESLGRIIAWAKIAKKIYVPVQGSGGDL